MYINKLPAMQDIVAYTKRPPILAPIGFVDGTVREYAVTPDVTVELLTKVCCPLFFTPWMSFCSHFVISSIFALGYCENR